MNEKRFLELLSELVAIESVNSDHGGPGEGAIQAFVFDWLRARGVKASVQEVSDGKRNVFARLGDPEAPAILIDGHMDTVSVEGWSEGSPFSLREQSGKYFGRGACDTKASLAVFMSLAARFAADPSALKRPFVFAATVDEESLQGGAFELAKLTEDLNLGGALTGEPTKSAIVTAHKGVCRYKISTTGKAAHGSTPELGESAIWSGHAVLNELLRLRKSLESAVCRSEMERGTLNIGRINGGSSFNIVPDRCEIDLDRRVGTSETLEEVEAQLVKIAGSVPGASLKNFVRRSALHTKESDPFPAALLRAAERVGEPTAFEQVRYMTNGVAYAEAGLPTVVFGPGSIEQAHKADEFIEEGQMERSFRILESFLMKAP